MSLSTNISCPSFKTLGPHWERSGALTIAATMLVDEPPHDPNRPPTSNNFLQRTINCAAKKRRGNCGCRINHQNRGSRENRGNRLC